MSPLTNIQILIGAGVVILALVLWIARLEIRIKKLTRGKNGSDLEESIGSILKDLTKIFEEQGGIKDRLDHVNKRVLRSVQRVDTVRFNPFASQGGNQSFSTLLLNEGGDGVILTGLYTREKSSVYAKPIRAYQSEFDLSDEERTLLDKAKN